MPLRLLRALAARALADLAPTDMKEGTVTVTDDVLDVTVTVRPHAAPPAPVTSPAPAGLRPIHEALLRLLTSESKSRQRLAREAGYSVHSSYVKGALADLVRLRLARVDRDGYARHGTGAT